MSAWKHALRVTICLLLTAVCAAAAVSDAMAAPRGYYFEFQKKKATPGASAEPFLEAAGEAQKTTRSNSCATKGYDYTYEYEDFILRTYTKEKKQGAAQYVSGIVLTSKEVKTPEGIKIGSKEKTVKKKYKNAKESFGVYTKTKGKTKIVIAVEDGKVSGIEIVLKQGEQI